MDSKSVLVNHPHHPEGEHKADAECGVDNLPKVLEHLDLPLMLLLALVAVQLLQCSLLYFLIYTDQAKQFKLLILIMCEAKESG